MQNRGGPASDLSRYSVTVPPPLARAGRRASGWFGAVGAVLAVMLVVGGLSAILVLRGDDTGDATAPAAPHASGQPAATSGADAGSGGFTAVEGLCEETDFSPGFHLLPLAEVHEDTGREGPPWHHSCIFQLGEDATIGLLAADVKLFGAPERAMRSYEELAAVAMSYDTREPAAGSWDLGTVFILESPSYTEVRLLMVDDALVLDLRLGATGSGADLEEQRAALVQIADNVRQVLRR